MPTLRTVSSAASFAAISLLYTLPYSQTTSERAAAIIKATGIEAGLCVHVGCGDGALTSGLSNGGKLLVHGLVLDNSSLAAARKASQDAGVYGTVAIEKLPSFNPLPYASNLVNLLVADLDTLGAVAPSDAEISRVLAPGGVSYVKRSGTWVINVKKRPSNMDSWTHYNYGPESNAVSHDKLVKPPTSLQWIAWYARPNDYGLHGEVSGGFRISKSMFFHCARFNAGRAPAPPAKQLIDARDAFNGTAIWKKDVTGNLSSRVGWFVDDTRLYTPLKKGSEYRTTVTWGSPMYSLDQKTGTQLMSYDNGGKLPPGDEGKALLINGLLVQAYRETLFVVDASTGALKWKYTEGNGNRLMFPAGAPELGKIFVASYTTGYYEGRWGGVRCKAITCFDLSSKQPVWQCTDFVGKGGGSKPEPNVGWLVYSDGKLALFGPTGILAAGDDPFLGVIDVATGKLLWSHNYQLGRGLRKNYTGYWPPNVDGFSYWPIWGQGCVFRDGHVWVTSSAGVYAFRPSDGASVKTIEPPVPNQRCNRARATDDYFITGFEIFIDKADRFVYQNIGRGSCASGIFPANGLLYYPGNGQCGCFTILRNQLALSSEPVGDTINDPKRLETGAAAKRLAQSAETSTAVSTGTMASESVFAARSPIFTSKPIADDWYNNDYLPYPNTDTVAANGKTFYAIVNEHRLVCASSGSTVWTFTAGGRISRAPVISNGLVFFGAHDGFVYCVRESDGALVWRFLAGRNYRKIMAFSQVESAWPVFGVILHEGNICFSAGHHPELDGGIYLWGLTPSTGKIAWKGVVRRDAQWRATTDKTERSYVNRIINGVLAPSGTSVSLPGITIDPKNPNIPVQARRGSAARGRASAPVVTQVMGGLTIKLQQEPGAAARVAVIDLSGRNVLTLTYYGGSTLFVPLSSVARGKYLLNVECGATTYRAPLSIKN